MNTSRNEDIKKTQRVLFELLRMFDGLCSEHDIEYFLAGGTCLGAVRHGGFLPWDDDVDLYMKASEWAVKEDVIREALPERYELITRETDELYGNPVIRISDSETTQISRSRVTDDSGKGVAIEIFLLDPMPDGEEERRAYREDFWLYCELMSPKKMMSSERIRIEDETEERYRQLCQRAAKEGRDAVLRELEDRLFCYSEEDCSTYHLRWAVHRIEFPVRAFAAQRRVPFEDAMMPVPEGFPEVLYGEYGDDWMMIPDLDGIWDHDTVLNTEVPYRTYVEAYEDRIDTEAFRKAQEKNKEIKLDRFFAHRKMDRLRADHLEAIALSCADRPDFRDIFMRIQEELFGSYRLIGAGDGFLAGLLRERLTAGDLRFVDKVSKLYEGDSEELRGIFADLEAIRRVRSSYFTGEGPEHMAEALELAGRYPGQRNMVEFICQVQIDEKGADDDAMDTVRKAILVHGRRPRLLKILADGYRAARDMDAAAELYGEISRDSSDGMVNLEIARMIEKGDI